MYVLNKIAISLRQHNLMTKLNEVLTISPNGVQWRLATRIPFLISTIYLWWI